MCADSNIKGSLQTDKDGVKETYPFDNVDEIILNAKLDNLNGNGGSEPISKNIVDVTDFGAVGDGETDDYQAIMDAIEYCVENNIKSVYFPARDCYALENVISLQDEKYSGLQLVSDGAILKANSTDCHTCFEVVGRNDGEVISDIQIHGLKFDANSSELNTGHQRGVHFWTDEGNIDNVIVTNVYTTGSDFAGLVVGGDNFIVTNYKAENHQGHGLSVGSSAGKKIILSNITAINCGLRGGYYGINLRSGWVILDDFYIDKCDYGLKTSLYNPHVNLSNGFVTNSNMDGIRIVQGSNVYMDNIITYRNGRRGFEFRHGIKMQAGTLVSWEDDWLSKAGNEGCFFVDNSEDWQEFNVDKLIIRGLGDTRGFRIYPDNVRIGYLEMNNTSQESYFYGDNVLVSSGYIHNNTGYPVYQKGDKTTFRDIKWEGKNAIYVSGGTGLRLFNNDFSEVENPLSGDALKGDFVIRDCIGLKDKKI